MKKLLSIICILVMCIGVVGCSYKEVKDKASTQLTTKEKVEDFEYMFETIKEAYPYLEVNKRLYKVDWVSNKEKYLDRIKNTKDDEEFIEEINKMLMDLKDGHTHLVYDKSWYEFLKAGYKQAGWYDFFGEENVENRYESIGYMDNRNKEVMPKKDIIVKDVVEGKIGYIHMPQMYPEGDDAYWQSVVSQLIAEDMKRTGYMLFRNDNEVMKKYSNKRGITLQPISELPKELLKKAPKEVLEDFSEFSTMSSLIPATNTSQFKGNIYLLVDEKVYSSAESFSIFCQESDFATIIGTTTAGGGGGIDPVLFELENSGLLVRMSSDMYLTDSGVCNEEVKTVPDYEIKGHRRTEKFEDDKCIEKVLELENLK